MPYLQVTTNTAVNRRQKVLFDEATAKALVIVPEEKPEYLMTKFEDCASMILQGSDEPCAMINLRVGQEMYERYPDAWLKMMEILTEIGSKILDIDKNRIYVVCTGTDIWTYEGKDIMTTLFK